MRESTAEKLLYRIPMLVKETVLWDNGYKFPICPRCKVSLEIEYQNFCDRCGQRLEWKRFKKRVKNSS